MPELQKACLYILTNWWAAFCLLLDARLMVGWGEFLVLLVQPQAQARLIRRGLVGEVFSASLLFLPPIAAKLFFFFFF